MIDENSTFGGFLTTIGEAKQANANALKTPWKLTHLLLGDANGEDPTPDPGQAQLVNQVHRAAINQLSIDPDNPGILVAEVVLPPNIGGWWIRELGIEDEDGDFVAVANCPPSYKPLLAQGSGRNQVVRMHLILSNTANVELKVDPAVVLATREYVDKEIEAHIASRNHPDATTMAKGFVQFATKQEHLDGQRDDRTAKPSGVKAMIDKAVKAGAYQFAAYDPDRTYLTGETCRGSDGVFYEFYDRDQTGEVQGVDPTNSENRPHVWMQWDGVKPGATIEWRSETLPEGYVENDGGEISRSYYRRVFSTIGTVYGAGDGETTFLLPDDRGEFKRGLDRGRGIDSGRTLGSYQKASLIIGNDDFDQAIWGGFKGAGGNKDMLGWEVPDVSDVTSAVAAQWTSPESGESLITSGIGHTGTGSVRPRNTSVVYLTKI